jgi:phosphoribosylformimino-5-aminoimidazole carboxamide ribotide isomerase
VIIFPAIDLHRGRCVRLRQGRRDAQTLYSDDPVAVAHRWVDEGAEWLHIVNLDGAFEAESPNFRIASDIAKTAGVPVQFGGGLRSHDDIGEALDMGAARVILGTVAVRNPELVSQAVRKLGAERILVSIDARDGMVAVRGWQETSEIGALSLARAMHRQGIRRIVYTDIARDGMLTGPDIKATRHLAEQTGMRVIASGGVASLEDIVRLRRAAMAGIEGVIIGQALYTGAVSLPRALALARADDPGGPG